MVVSIAATIETFAAMPWALAEAVTHLLKGGREVGFVAH
jgi:predicted Co/Zn/Cd cation transporter (cation efflux family)